MNGQELARRRKALGLSQDDLGNALGFTGRQVRTWETDGEELKPFLDLAMAELLRRQMENNPPTPAMIVEQAIRLGALARQAQALDKAGTIAGRNTRDAIRAAQKLYNATHGEDAFERLVREKFDSKGASITLAGQVHLRPDNRFLTEGECVEVLQEVGLY